MVPLREIAIKIGPATFQIELLELLPAGHPECGDWWGMTDSANRKIKLFQRTHALTLETLIHECTHAYLGMMDKSQDQTMDKYDEESVAKMTGYFMPHLIAQFLTWPPSVQDDFGVILLTSQARRIGFLLAGLPPPQTPKCPKPSAPKKSAAKTRPHSKQAKQQPAAQRGKK